MRSLPLLLAVPLTLACAAPSLAAEHSLGFSAGGTSGIGFTYRYFGTRGLGAQVTGLYAHSTGSDTYSVGAQALMAFQQVGIGRLYGLSGVGYTPGINLIVGAGPGIEIGGDRGATLAFELPLSYFQGNLLPIPNVSYLFKF